MVGVTPQPFTASLVLNSEPPPIQVTDTDESPLR
jgi:hypothetical protein